jgi:hypothetical protein
MSVHSRKMGPLARMDRAAAARRQERELDTERVGVDRMRERHDRLDRTPTGQDWRHVLATRHTRATQAKSAK